MTFNIAATKVNSNSFEENIIAVVSFTGANLFYILDVKLYHEFAFGQLQIGQEVM